MQITNTTTKSSLPQDQKASRKLVLIKESISITNNFSMFNISRAQAKRTRKLEKTKNNVNAFLKIKVLKSMQKQRIHGGTINNIVKVT